MDSGKKEAYDKFTRTGFIIKGVIYVLLGMLALVAAVGSGGKTTGRLGVLVWLDHQPLGPGLLILIMIGILGYVTLRLMQALKDTNHKGSGWKGLSTRVAYFISGLTYLMLFFACFFTVFFRTSFIDKEDANFIARIIELPAGNIAIGIAGGFLFGFGLFEIGRALTGAFNHHLNFNHLNEKTRRILNSIGVVGYLARGVILCIMGFLIVKTAFKAFVDQASFISQAFSLLSSFLGEFYMGTVAAGLVFYGSFYFVKAKFYQITVQ